MGLNCKQLRLLRRSWDEQEDDDIKPKHPLTWLAIIVTALFLLFAFYDICLAAPAPKVNIEALANAIYIAEGGAKTRHPYGILAKYKHTTPRQACINTIKSALKRWDGKGDFIAFLGRTYCPVGASNDPRGLNVNWVKNVTKLYNKGVKSA